MEQLAVLLWRHVAAIREGTTMKIYIDGVLDGTKTVTSPANLNGNNPFKLGRSYTPFSPADIEFKDVRIYNGIALCHAKILELINEASSTSC